MLLLTKGDASVKPDLVLPAKVIVACAVYGWFSNNEYVYIGQSINTIRRLKRHHVVDKSILTIKDEFHIWYCSYSELNKFERSLILRFKPRYNKQFPLLKSEPKREITKEKTKRGKYGAITLTKSELARIKEKYGYELPLIS
jgi:hypothetical protein